MKTIRINQASDIKNLNVDSIFSSGTVTALGFFDGVHLAHRALIDKAKALAKTEGYPLVIFTFSGDENLLKSGSAKLFTDSERLSIFEDCGADCTVIASFSLFRDTQKESFVNDFLIGVLNTRIAVCGFNFKFGKNANGSSEHLLSLMKKAGRKAEILDEYLYSGKTLSSTYIRELLSNNKLAEAAKLLGKPYFISGKVLHGLGIGKGLGIPTINTDLQKGKFVPRFGVYLAAVKIRGKIYKALCNVGACPTFTERDAHAETYILDFDGNLYEREVKIYLLAFLREEKKFSSAKDLIMQINVDKIEALKLSGELKWQELGLN